MGILSKIKQKRISGSVDKLDDTKKRTSVRVKKDMDEDLCKSLAFYVVSLEVLMAKLFGKSDSVTAILDKFRSDWKAEEIINSIVPYDSVFKSVYKKVDKWINENLEMIENE